METKLYRLKGGTMKEDFNPFSLYKLDTTTDVNDNEVYYFMDDRNKIYCLAEGELERDFVIDKPYANLAEELHEIATEALFNNIRDFASKGIFRIKLENAIPTDVCDLLVEQKIEVKVYQPDITKPPMTFLSW